MTIEMFAGVFVRKVLSKSSLKSVISVSILKYNGLTSSSHACQIQRNVCLNFLEWFQSWTRLFFYNDKSVG